MSVDRLSDMTSALKNASLVGKTSIEMFYSKECEGVGKVLKKFGFLDEVKTFKQKGKSYKMLQLSLSRNGDIFKIADVKRVSRPGRRVYKKSKELTKVAGGYGVSVVSTSRGIMAAKDAKKKHLGGEVLCEVQ